MSSILCSQGMVVATAMAVSGTVILLAFRLQKSQFPVHHQHSPSHRVLRPCISSSEGRKREKKKSKKRVHFAKDVVEPRGDGEEFRRQHGAASGAIVVDGRNSYQSSSPNFNKGVADGVKETEMPANRVALYNGILRDRTIQRMAYSY